jgi:hypothetical protein
MVFFIVTFSGQSISHAQPPDSAYTVNNWQRLEVPDVVSVLSAARIAARRVLAHVVPVGVVDVPDSEGDGAALALHRLAVQAQAGAGVVELHDLPSSMCFFGA